MNVLLELNFKQKNATRLFTIICGLISFIMMRDSAKASMLLGALLALALKNPTIVYSFANTIGRDIIAGHRFLLLNVFIALMERRGWSLARIFQQTARRNPNKTCFSMEDHIMTFQQVETFTNKVGAYFRAQQLQHGDCVALLMETRPEYPCFWLGLSKIGVTTALINSHLRRETLVHSIKVANAKAIIVGTELTAALQDVIRDPEVSTLKIYQFSDETQRNDDNFALIKRDNIYFNGINSTNFSIDAIDLSKELEAQEPQNLSDEIRACKLKDKLMYVYTSGTTGLPKAAVITNLRYLFMCSAIYYMLALKPNDIIYNPLPLYHTAGGIVAVGNALVHGCTVVMRKKFSASNFWNDCIRYDCSVAQYIGELCRYLLCTPQRPEDTQHNLRMMYGNGLRPQIWTQFVSRFNIPHIGEVYGSTEGNSNLANVTNRVGAVGFVPIMARRFFPVQIIKCDEETGEPIRDRNGNCIRCRPGETGLLIGKVDAKRAATAFNGYADKEASEKKLIKNVFGKSDLYFNSGDMVIGDILGYFYFKDRTGDTFRWRGENVSTLEVEAIITNVVGLQDCVVYGVDIPHIEGKAGMAAIVDPDRKVDLQHLSSGIRGSLPTYAQPLFIRLMDAIPQTATFKMKKRDLMLQSFDIDKIKDPIYYLNRDGIYRPLMPEQFDQLQKGNAGL